MTPAGTSNDVQNGWEENTHTYQNISTAVVLYCFVESVVYTCKKFSAHGTVSSYVGFQNIVIIDALPRVRWHRASSPQGSSSDGCCLCITTGRMLLCSSLFPHPLLVCVCVFSSHPFWTSSSLDVPAGVTQEEGHTGFLIHLPSAVRALIFVARRIQPFLSLVDREVEF